MMRRATHQRGMSIGEFWPWLLGLLAACAAGYGGFLIAHWPWWAALIAALLAYNLVATACGLMIAALQKRGTRKVRKS